MRRFFCSAPDERRLLRPRKCVDASAPMNGGCCGHASGRISSDERLPDVSTDASGPVDSYSNHYIISLERACHPVRPRSRSFHCTTYIYNATNEWPNVIVQAVTVAAT